MTELKCLTFLRVAGVVLVYACFSFDLETREKKVLSDANRNSLSFFCVFDKHINYRILCSNIGAILI